MAADVDAALSEAGLRYDDELHIYNRYPNGADSGMSVFGVANLVEPGTLEIGAMAETGTPGLTLFLQFPVRCARCRPSIYSPAQHSNWPPG